MTEEHAVTESKEEEAASGLECQWKIDRTAKARVRGGEVMGSKTPIVRTGSSGIGDCEAREIERFRERTVGGHPVRMRPATTDSGREARDVDVLRSARPVRGGWARALAPFELPDSVQTWATRGSGLRRVARF
jgi:hypothetical protein